MVRTKYKGEERKYESIIVILCVCTLFLSFGDLVSLKQTAEHKMSAILEERYHKLANKKKNHPNKTYYKCKKSDLMLNSTCIDVVTVSVRPNIHLCLMNPD